MAHLSEAFMKRSCNFIFVVYVILIIIPNSALVVDSLGATLREYSNALRAEKSNGINDRKRGLNGRKGCIDNIFVPHSRGDVRQRRRSLRDILSKWRRGANGSGDDTIFSDESSSNSNASTSNKSYKGGTANALDTTMKDTYISTTRSWVRNWVVVNNLCPWAAATLQGSKLRITVCVNSDYRDNAGDNFINNEKIIEKDVRSVVLEASRRAVLEEVKLLCDAAIGSNAKDNHGTTLICLRDYVIFEEYLELVALVEESLVSTGVNKLVQLATFHPNYQFEGCDEDDITNYTNRSPYPMIHLLKVAEVKDAIDQYGGDTKEIYLRNKKLMRAMTIKDVASAFQGFMNSSNF